MTEQRNKIPDDVWLRRLARRALARPLVNTTDSTGNPYQAVKFTIGDNEFYVDSMIASEDVVVEEMRLAFEWLAQADQSHHG